LSTPSRPEAAPIAGKVLLLTLGGTISMAGRDGAAVVRLNGADLLAGVAGPGGDPQVVVRDVRAVPSAHLTFGDVLEILAAADEAVAAGARGIVLTQGTDTLEESAFLLDLLWRHPVPFVVTGAMRNSSLPGADGPANITAAVRVASDERARERGVLVVFNDEIHATAHVRKTHSMSTATFRSPDLGPIGRVVEGSVRFHAVAPRPRPISDLDPARVAGTRVALHTVTMDDDGAQLAGLADSHDGLVVAAFGVGHVPGSMAPVLGDLAAAMPVVLTSRTGAGPVLTDTYGAPGSERDLLHRGLINGGFLHPYKARVLLRLLLASGAGPDDIRRRLAELG
jgi:L-asparaginase